MKTKTNAPFRSNRRHGVWWCTIRDSQRRQLLSTAWMQDAVITGDATMQATLYATDVADNEENTPAESQNKDIDKGLTAIIYEDLLERPSQIIATTWKGVKQATCLFLCSCFQEEWILSSSLLTTRARNIKQDGGRPKALGDRYVKEHFTVSGVNSSNTSLTTCGTRLLRSSQERRMKAAASCAGTGNDTTPTVRRRWQEGDS